MEETAAAIDAAGGKGIPVICDHADDAQARRGTRARCLNPVLLLVPV